MFLFYHENHLSRAHFVAARLLSGAHPNQPSTTKVLPNLCHT